MPYRQELIVLRDFFNPGYTCQSSPRERLAFVLVDSMSNLLV
jgi:hypothetical protein